MLKEDILLDFIDISMDIKKELVDEIAFDLLTLEEFIPQLISMCGLSKTSRYDLIDDIKEGMVEVLFDSEIYDRDKSLRELLEKDVELIQIEQLVSRMNHENKKLILFNISKKYPNLMKIIGSRANLKANGLMVESLEMMFEGSVISE